MGLSKFIKKLNLIYIMKKGVIILILIVVIGIGGFFFFDYSKPDIAEKQVGNTEFSVEEEHWNRLFEKAFETVDCSQARNPSTLPEGYYKGQMLDTHIHLKSLPDGEPGFPLEFYTGENLGTTHSMDEWICMMDYEGTYKAFGFFPVWEPIINKSIEAVNMTMKKYPGRFVPFIMPPADDGSPTGYPTVNSRELNDMLVIEPGLFEGYGEIGLYSRGGGAKELPPDSQRLQEIYPVLREQNLVAYFHLGENQGDSLERVAGENRDIKFIFHGDQLVDCAECNGNLDEVAGILERNPNIYYGVDELYGGDWLLKPGESKEKFLANFEDYDIILEKDLARWKEFIETHPDQVLWGTDRGVSTSWDLDTDVALTLNNYTRAFIGRLDTAVQEKFAYKNAERLLEEK